MLEIYHGSAIEVRTPQIIEVGFNKDFGNGFYCTNIDVQAKKCATRKGKGKGFVSVYEYDYLKTRNLNILVFNEMTQEWLDFIAACRSGKEHSYDIVEGPMADDEIYTFVNQFLKGEISRTAFWDIGRVYMDLILRLKGEMLDTLIEVYNSYIAKCIDDYNIGFYYCIPECIYESYKAGEMLD
jgi:hypothetical protein